MPMSTEFHMASSLASLVSVLSSVWLVYLNAHYSLAWNAPLTLGTRAFANAIMAGNAVILKSSEYSPGVHAFAAKLFHDAGLPAGVLNVIHVATPDAPSVCETIIAHPAVRKLNFTGSTGVGSKLAELCGRHLIPCVMELGGKSPVIILPDADLKAAVSAIMFGGFMNSGQICMS